MHLLDISLVTNVETSFLQTPWREAEEDQNWALTEFSTGGLYQRGILMIFVSRIYFSKINKMVSQSLVKASLQK